MPEIKIFPHGCPVDDLHAPAGGVSTQQHQAGSGAPGRVSHPGRDSQVESPPDVPGPLQTCGSVWCSGHLNKYYKYCGAPAQWREATPTEQVTTVGVAVTVQW